MGKGREGKEGGDRKGKGGMEGKGRDGREETPRKNPGYGPATNIIGATWGRPLTGGHGPLATR